MPNGSRRNAPPKHGLRPQEAIPAANRRAVVKTHARVVVIGGGAVGCSILYHLTEAGWTDAILVERDELTAGSTWHAAGLLPLFNMSYATGQMHKYSIELYIRLAAAWQRDVGFRQVGNLRMARTRERMDEF